jgi:hypothetical protein
MSVSEYDDFKLANPHLERYFEEAPSLSYSGTKDLRSKTDNTWKEVMSKIAEKHPASKLAEQYGKKTIKETKTRNIFDKHLKKAKNNQR